MAGARKMQMKMMVDFVLEKTESANEKDFLERYINSQKITENLKSLQLQADSKLILLKAEYQSLYENWSIGDSGVLTSTGTNNSSSSSTNMSKEGRKEKGAGTVLGRGGSGIEVGDDEGAPLTDVSTLSTYPSLKFVDIKCYSSSSLPYNSLPTTCYPFLLTYFPCVFPLFLSSLRHGTLIIECFLAS